MSTLTSAPHVAFFMSFWIFSLAADHPEVTVKAGEDFTLECQAPGDAQIEILDWIRPDLKSYPYIFRFIPQQSTTENQDPSYRDRVELRDPNMKAGDVSVVLKKVRVSDTGTYLCRVGREGEKHKVYSTIQLIVSDPDVIEVTVHPGDDVILPCQAAGSSISAVVWSRHDLKPDTVLLYSDGHLNTTQQHPSFKDRVELVDRDLKDGDVSLILKSVNINDAGTYKCGVKTGGTYPIIIRIIRLQVPEPGSPVGLIVGLTVLLLLLLPVAVVAAVVGVWKSKRPGRDIKRTVVMVVPRLRGEKAILRCQADDSSISAVEWSRADLKPDTILSYRDKWSVPSYPHPDYKEDKVQLVDRDLKKGNMSLVLWNVIPNDQGTYECRVTSRGSRWKNIPFLPSEPIRIIHLKVREQNLIKVTVHPGDDVILPCQDEDPSICAVEWSRADLKPESILSYRVEGSVTTYQHPKYKEDKVQLVDKDLKKGNMSLILKNVSTTDQGTYKCRVTSRGSMRTNTTVLPRETITIIRLQVREPADLIEVTVHPGDDVILPFQAADSSIRAVEWTRPDLEPDTILLYYDGNLYTIQQHPSFKDRVDLVNGYMEDGDVSLILKNVNRHDAGTYECRVTVAGSEGNDDSTSDPIRFIRLQVTEPDLIVVTVHPGDDVILPCQAADSSISVVEWSRADLDPDIILLNIDGHLDPTHQHPSFKDRVELVDRDLKDRDVSLILKNVNIHDDGTYECRVRTGYFDPIRTITIIHLQVADLIEVVRPGDDALLQCRAADSSISFVMWSKPDLGQCVFLYRDEILDPYNQQHPFFKGRVEMMGIHRKDGDVSLTLKNVSRHDAGRYECRVKTLDSEKVGIISLQVPDAIVEVHAGDNATLPCQTDDSSIRAVEWSRTDLKPDNAFLYRDDRNEPFKSRVDRDPKTGDVSLILKNVKIYHTGTYECRVKTVVGFKDGNGDIDSEPIRILRIIRLQVTEPDEIVVVRPGDNAILPCKVADPSINDIKWTRPDKHPSFKDRVYLVNRDLNDRDVSLTLENVSRHDAGIYECRVNTGGSKLKKIDSEPIRTVRLQVADESVVNNETDDRNGTKEDINSDSLINIPLLNHQSAGNRASRSREDRNSSHVV
ncbi:hemicentin-1-like isoform X2 [Perca fluviatilis]|uniref:hemicentin-1-like isoform X2 n=1 Tax=Perca fluviatilis TaxID=8168 RepID=UPI0019663C40|nr:hemicentin-1-like isoform X2 [Perca fluviatilis]